MMVSVSGKSIFSPLPDDEVLATFANTGHDGPDPLVDLAGVRAWWAGIGSPGALPTGRAHGARELEELRAVRQTIRDLTLRNNGVEVDVDATVLETIPLHIVLGARAGVRVADGSTAAAAVLGLVGSALLRAAAGADWRRLKACPGPDCGWVFTDRTRNGSRRWCQMRECGNRAKGAAFRARNRDRARSTSG